MHLERLVWGSAVQCDRHCTPGAAWGQHRPKQCKQNVLAGKWAFSDGWGWQLGATVNLSRFQDISYSKTSSEPLHQTFFLGLQLRVIAGQCALNSVGVFPASLPCHPGSAENTSSEVSWTNHSTPSAFPENRDSPALSPQVPIPMVAQGVCPSWGQVCWGARGKLLLPPRTDKLKVKQMLGFGLTVGCPCSDWSCITPCLGQGSLFGVPDLGWGLQMAGAVCELTLLPQGLLGRIDCTVRKQH